MSTATTQTAAGEGQNEADQLRQKCADYEEVIRFALGCLVVDEPPKDWQNTLRCMAISVLRGERPDTLLDELKAMGWGEGE